MKTNKTILTVVTCLIIVTVLILTFILWQQQVRLGRLRGAQAAQSEKLLSNDVDQTEDDHFIAPAKQACMTAMLNVRMAALQGKDTGVAPLKGPDAENLELLYNEPLQGITKLNPATLILRQKTPVRLPSRKWARLYGLAEGSVLTAKTDDNNFEQWEADYAAKYLRKTGQ